jgi:hypothetical protein
MTKTRFAALAAAVVALAPVASHASNQKHGLQWHYVGNPYTSCGDNYTRNGMRGLEIWFTYPAASWENYEADKTRPPCTRLVIPVDGFCLQFTAANLMQGTVSYWSFDAQQWPALTTIDGYNSGSGGWSFSITVASDSLGNLAFGDGWVMSASNEEFSVISNGLNKSGGGGSDEVTGPNGGYARRDRDPGTWTDPPVEIVTPDAAPAACDPCRAGPQ